MSVGKTFRAMCNRFVEMIVQCWITFFIESTKYSGKVNQGHENSKICSFKLFCSFFELALVKCWEKTTEKIIIFVVL
jgi:hypothetical protein